MKNSRFTDGQILSIPKQGGTGLSMELKRVGRSSRITDQR